MAPVDLSEFGCRRTGTTYLKAVVEANFEEVAVHNMEGGWKHGLVEPGADVDGYLVVAKDPYAWLASMDRYFGTNPPQRLWRWIESRIDPEWHFVKTRALLLDGYFMKYAYWFDALEDRPHVYLRYEDLLEDLASSLGEIRDAFDLTPAGDRVEDVDRRTESPPPKQPVGFGGAFDPTYYTERRYLDDLDADEVEQINEYITFHRFEPVLDRLGYELVE